MKYQITYHVEIPNPSEQLRFSQGTVTSKIFDFPNLINAGESININFTKYINGNQLADPFEYFQISLNIKNVSHNIDGTGGYTEIYASDEVKDQGSLECKLDNARKVFAKLKG